MQPPFPSESGQIIILYVTNLDFFLKLGKVPSYSLPFRGKSVVRRFFHPFGASSSLESFVEDSITGMTGTKMGTCGSFKVEIIGEAQASPANHPPFRYLKH